MATPDEPTRADLERQLREATRDLRVWALRGGVALALLVALFVPVARVERIGYGDPVAGTLVDLVPAQALALLVLVGGLATVALLGLCAGGAGGLRRAAAAAAVLTLVLVVAVVVVDGDPGTGRTGDWRYEVTAGVVPLLVLLALACSASLRRSPSEING
jgi:hypothetical protein